VRSPFAGLASLVYAFRTRDGCKRRDAASTRARKTPKGLLLTALGKLNRFTRSVKSTRRDTASTLLAPLGPRTSPRADVRIGLRRKINARSGFAVHEVEVRGRKWTGCGVPSLYWAFSPAAGSADYGQAVHGRMYTIVAAECQGEFWPPQSPHAWTGWPR
jgi:hypothetical protein